MVPAQAGVFRRWRPSRPARTGGPRAGGGVPARSTTKTWPRPWSPRRRGCSGSGPAAVGSAVVVPAQAGVFRRIRLRPLHDRCGPRAGGGVPPRTVPLASSSAWSPRRRGCSEPALHAEWKGHVVPAQAGVFRPRATSGRRFTSGPRAGGGVPIPLASARRNSPWSPRRRGCSARVGSDHDGAGVVPAQAGVFRRRAVGHLHGRRGPRAGGGVPWCAHDRAHCPAWSPRRRGCSAARTPHDRDHSVVPAQAGVFRSDGDGGTGSHRGPRAGGGVPASPALPRPLPAWSLRRGRPREQHRA